MYCCLCGTALSAIQWYVVRISYYLNLQYSFLKILLQKTRALKQIGHRVHSSQSIRYVLFQSRRELKGQLKGQYLGLVQNRTFALPTFRYKEYCFIYCFSLKDYLLF